MKPQYLKLTDGREVRVEWNMNSLGSFTHDTGIEMATLAEGKADIYTLRKIAWHMVKEGEETEGRSFELSEVELGRLMGQAQVIAFAQIFAEQTGSAEQKKSEAPDRMKKIFFRKG